MPYAGMHSHAGARKIEISSLPFTSAVSRYESGSKLRYDWRNRFDILRFSFDFHSTFDACHAVLSRHSIVKADLSHHSYCDSGLVTP